MPGALVGAGPGQLNWDNFVADDAIERQHAAVAAGAAMQLRPDTVDEHADDVLEGGDGDDYDDGDEAVLPADGAGGEPQ